jgi:hypothetical protein
MIGLLCFVLAVLASPIKSKLRLQAENAMLRHRLIILRRKLHGRVRLTNNDRWFLIQHIAGSHQSCRFSQSSGPRRSCVGTGPAFAYMRRRESRGFFAIKHFLLPSVQEAHAERKSALTARTAPCLAAMSGQPPKPGGSRRKARGVDGESACQATMVPGHYAANVTAFCVAVDPLSPLKFRLRLSN